MPGLYYGGTYYDEFSLTNPETQGSVDFSGDISVTTGIALNGEATYAWNVDNGGTIEETGPAGPGIGVYLRAGGMVTNAAGATISGPSTGVRIVTSTNGVGSSRGEVTNAGTISGGIEIIGDGSVSNGSGGAATGFITSPAGASDGVDISGIGSISNGSTIVGGLYLGGGTIDNAAGGSITANGIGVETGTKAAGTVTNAGTINEAGNAGPGLGAYLRAGGVVSNAAGATISGVSTGVRIVTSTDGVGSSTGDVFNSGTISGGIVVNGDGTVANMAAAVITSPGGTSEGADVSGVGSIGNYGTINGGLYLGGGTVSNAAGQSVSANGIGVEIGTKAAGTVINAGTISEAGNAGPGLGVYLRAGGLVSNAAGAQIKGISTGVRIVTSTNGVGSNTGSVSNSGTISGGIDINGDGTINNGPASVITSPGGTSQGADVSGVGSIGNFGTIVGGVYLGGGIVTNAAGESISANGIGVEIGTKAAGTVINGGTISETGNAGPGLGVYLRAGGTVTNGLGGTITGVSTGVRIVTSSNGSGSSSGYVANAGSIAGGIDINGDGSVRNGSAGAAAQIVSKGGTSQGVDVSGTGSIGNYGTIVGGIYLGGGSVTNAKGASVSANGIGVEIGTQVTGTLLNYGTIVESGNAGPGLGVYLRDGGMVTNAAGATIAGVSTGIRITGTGGTVVDHGTISGGTFAVDFNGDNNTLRLDPSAAINGGVDATGTNNTLELMPGSGTGTLPGSAGQFSDFNKVVVDDGANWQIDSNMVNPNNGIAIGNGSSVVLKGTISTAVSFTGSGRLTVDPGNFGGTISGLQPGDTLHLPNTPGNAAQIVGQTLSVTNNGSTTATFKLSATYNAVSGSDLSATPDPEGGIDVSMKGAISPEMKERYLQIAQALGVVAKSASLAGILLGGGVKAVLEYAVGQAFESLCTALKVPEGTAVGAEAVLGVSIDIFNIVTDLADPEALTADVISALSNAAGIYFSNLHADPADADFTTISAPPTLSFPLPDVLLHQPNSAIVTATVNDFLSLISFGNAQLAAAQKYGGAIVAGDAASAAMQLAVFDQFSSQTRDSSLAVAADLALLGPTMASVASTDLSASQSEITAAIQAATGNVLPGDTVLDLMSLTSLSAPEINAEIQQALLQFDPTMLNGSLSSALGATANSLNLLRLPPAQSPIVLDNFGWAQGWGSPNDPRMVSDVDGNGTADYLGFGDSAVFVSDGGTFVNGQAQTGPGFTPAVAEINDFGVDEGYTAAVQRGAVVTGAGVNASATIYGQGFAGIYWYATTGETPQTDAAGKVYDILQYQASPGFYGNFGSQQGWAPANGFDIVKAHQSDAYASILGFGNDGIVVGPQAFAPGATADNSYLIPFATGNNSGWNQQNDIRTFTDKNGNPIDLNHDGVTDFVGTGPQGLVYAFGNNSGQGGSYSLGPLTTAAIGFGGGADLGDAQGWSNPVTLRDIVADKQTGFDDIIAFGAAGVFVAMGQDPATHGGQAFGPLYLAMPDFGSNQGWSVQNTPRLVGDVNGDGTPDIVGFGFNSTFAAIGSRDSGGNLHFALDATQTIGDFGSAEAWSGTDPQTIRTLGDIAGTGRADLILSGAFNTQVWQFN